jgi:phosphoglycerate dehydrogenase-like enzyme
MIASLLEKSGTSAGPQEDKPKGLYFLTEPVFSQIYNPEVRAQIAQIVDIPECPITDSLYDGSDKTWPGVEMIFASWGFTLMDEIFLMRFPDLKIVFYGAGSIKPYVTRDFWQSGVRITNAAAANAIPVAEYTCAQIIQGLKGCWQKALYIRKERKFPKISHPPGAYQSTVGLLSLGAIGRKVAEWCTGRDLRVIAYDPYVTAEEAEKVNVRLLSLEEVFAQADVVSCHMPWLPETEGIIRARHFDLLKPQATFINTARGAVIDERGMIESLRKRPDVLAILDVTHPEPPVTGSPLYMLANVILTPHIAGSMGQECNRMGQYMLEELGRYVAREPLRYEVNERHAVILA